MKEKLTRQQYHVTQEKGTERFLIKCNLQKNKLKFFAFRPFSGDHLDEKSPGVFNCIVCDQEIFSSKTKFESGSGWPSFYDVINSDRVKLIQDNSYGNFYQKNLKPLKSSN